MTQFTAKTKGEAARKIPLIKAQIIEEASSFNSKRTIPLLLCLEDSVNNLEIKTCKRQPVERNVNHPLINLALTNLIIEWYAMIDAMIENISEYGFYDSTTKIQRLGINFAVLMGSQQEQEEDLKTILTELKGKGEIGSKPILFGQPRLFFSKIPGSCYIILNDNTTNQLRNSCLKILKFRDLLYEKGALETMVHRTPNGTEVSFGKAGIEVKFPKGFVVESLLEKIGVTPRSIDAQSHIRDWNSEFSKRSTETLKTIDAGKNRENLNNLEKEFAEICRSYSSLPEFSETFEKLFHIEMAVFFSIFSELQRSCYYKEHTVGVWEFNELLKSKSLQKYGPENLRKTIELISVAIRPRTRNGGLIILHDLVMTNFKRLSTAYNSLLDICFDEFYDKNSKGEAFENGCRKMLSDGGLNTIPGRVDILEPILPPDVSISLWGKQKMGTDIDVIAAFSNNILVLECKEYKWNLPTESENNLFRKFQIEHFYRTKWISDNLRKFETYAGKDWGNIAGKLEPSPIYFFPLLISTRLVETGESEKAPLLTFVELKEIIAKKWVVKTTEKGGEAELMSGTRKIKLPCFMGNSK